MRNILGTGTSLTVLNRDIVFVNCTKNTIFEYLLMKHKIYMSLVTKDKTQIPQLL